MLRAGERRPRPPPATAAAGAGGRLGLLFVLAGLLGLRPGALGLGFGCFELGGDQRVVLGAEVDLLRIVAGACALGRLLVADELVLALELLDVADA